MKRFTKTFSTLSIYVIEFINRLTNVGNRKLYKSYYSIRNQEIDGLTSLLKKHTKNGKYDENILIQLIILISFLKQKYFDQIRIDLGNSEATIINRKLGHYFTLKSKSKNYIRNIIQHEFNQTSIQSEEIDQFLSILVDAIISGDRDVLCQEADITIIFKAEILKYIESLNISYKTQLDREFFNIAILAMCKFEASEWVFYYIKKYKIPEDSFSFIFFDQNHAFIRFGTYSQYVQNRYALIKDSYNQ